MYVALGILGLSFLVIVHESGHYLAARAFGMKVLRYSIGFGPTLFKYQPKGSDTIFQISAIPFLAYVQIDGMNPTDEVRRDDPTLFSNKSVIARIITIVAGPIGNYLAASFILLFVFSLWGVQEPNPSAPPRVTTVVPRTPAAEAGVLRGDLVMEVEGQPVTSFSELQRATEARGTRETRYVVERAGERLTFTITPRDDNDDRVPRIGIVGPMIRRPLPLDQAAQLSITGPFIYSLNSLSAMGRMIQERDPSDLTGPVGMTRQVAVAAEQGVPSFLELLAVISVALGLFNLLPIPALDGGRLVFLMYEAVTRRRADEKVETVVHFVGLLFLLSLIAMVTFRELRG